MPPIRCTALSCGPPADTSARQVQGIGASMTMAVGPAIVTAAFPSSERGKALGINAVIVAGTAMIGPTIGGLLVDFVDWRSAFYLRVPVGLVGVVVAWVILREPMGRSVKERFDLPGAIVLSAALTSLVLALGSLGSPLATALLLAAVAGLGLFLLIEQRVKDPLVDLSLFGNRLFSAAALSSLLSFMATYAIVFLMPFYLQQVLGMRPAEVGMVLVAQPLMVVAIAPLSGLLSDRIGSRLLSSSGLAVVCLGLVSLSQLGSSTDRLEVVARLALVGLGQAFFQSPNNSAIMGSVPRRRLGFASSMLASMRNLGMAVGTAVSTTVFSARLAYHAGSASPGPDAFVAAMHDALIVAAAIASIGVLASLVRGKSHHPGDTARVEDPVGERERPVESQRSL